MRGVRTNEIKFQTFNFSLPFVDCLLAVWLPFLSIWNFILLVHLSWERIATKLEWTIEAIQQKVKQKRILQYIWFHLFFTCMKSDHLVEAIRDHFNNTISFYNFMLNIHICILYNLNFYLYLLCILVNIIYNDKLKIILYLLMIRLGNNCFHVPVIFMKHDILLVHPESPL